MGRRLIPDHSFYGYAALIYPGRLAVLDGHLVAWVGVGGLEALDSGRVCLWWGGTWFVVYTTFCNGMGFYILVLA